MCRTVRAMTSDESTVHEQIAQGLKDHPARKGVLFNVMIGRPGSQADSQTQS